MKTAISVEDGGTQIVLTPATDFEQDLLARIPREELVDLQVAKGHVFACPEGWQHFGGDQQCLMLRLGGSPASPRDGHDLSPRYQNGQDGFLQRGEA